MEFKNEDGGRLRGMQAWVWHPFIVAERRWRGEEAVAAR
jgi:hypothetical protein